MPVLRRGYGADACRAAHVTLRVRWIDVGQPSVQAYRNTRRVCRVTAALAVSYAGLVVLISADVNEPNSPQEKNKRAYGKVSARTAEADCVG